MVFVGADGFGTSLNASVVDAMTPQFINEKTNRSMITRPRWIGLGWGPLWYLHPPAAQCKKTQLQCTSSACETTPAVEKRESDARPTAICEHM